MRRVVLDTNDLVAALRHPDGPCGRLLDLVVDGAVEVCLDTRIQAEYAGGLSRRKFHLVPGKIRVTLGFFRQRSTPVIAHPLGVVLLDPEDLPFLEWPLVTRTWSGNRRHFPKAATGSVRVLSSGHASRASKHTPDPSASA